MPKISIVAKNYAKALFLSAKKNNAIDQTFDELTKFKKNFNTDFARELKNPVISKIDLSKIVNDITSRLNLGQLSSSFLSFVVKNRRLNLFPEIYEEFSRLDKKQKNILEVEVISQAKPNEEQIKNIKSAIEKQYQNKTIEIKEVIKKKILGGIQIKIESKIIDLSLKNQLESLKKDCLSIVD